MPNFTFMGGQKCGNTAPFNRRLASGYGPARRVVAAIRSAIAAELLVLFDEAILRVTVTGQLFIAVAILLLFIQKLLALTHDTTENSRETMGGSS